MTMKIFYHKNYNAAKHESDTTRKSEHIAKYLGFENMTSPDYLLGVTSCTILDIHDSTYVDSVYRGTNMDLAESQGFDWDAGLGVSAKWSTAGMLAACDYALINKTIAGTLSTGLHHAKYYHGEGYCTFNGLVAAAHNYYKTRDICILDFDAHCGGGTVSMLNLLGMADKVSQYDICTSDYDEYIPDENHQIISVSNDKQYMEAVHTVLNEKVDWNNVGLILYNAGTDPYPTVRHETLYKRDRMVFNECIRNNVPCAFTIAGGYTWSQSMDSLVQSHVNTVRAAETAVNRQKVS